MGYAAQIPDGRITWPPRAAPTSAVVFAHNAVDVRASPQRVWSLLVDCTSWPRWYKHCSDVSILRGDDVLGSSSKFRFKTLQYYFEPEVVTFEPNRMLIWSAKGPAGTSGAHAWYIDPTLTGCRVITEEAQHGFLLRLIRSRARANLLAAHEDWLLSLKALAEAQ